MSSFSPILILAAQRTGTNLLRSSLALDPRVLSLVEFLNPQPHTHHPKFGFWAKYDPSHRGALDDGTDYATRLQVFRDYLADVESANPERILLADLKYNHVGLVDTLWRDVDHPPAVLSAFLERGAVVVHLFRQNPLAQFCSFKLATETGIWVQRAARSGSAHRVWIDPLGLVDNLRRIEFRVAVADLWLQNYARLLKFPYEALYEGERLAGPIVSQIESLLGTPLRLGAIPTKKIAPPLVEMIQNAEDVRAALRASPYEWCLDERFPGTESADKPEVELPLPARGRSDRLRRSSRRKVLIASELGVGSRSLRALAEVADTLAERGIDAVWAAPDLGQAASAVPGGAAVVQAPSWPLHRHFGFQGGIASYADVLTRLGFGDAVKLAAMVAAWDTLLECIAPDAVIAHSSPALQLALLGGPTPLITWGSAYGMPPLDYDHFPPLRGNQQPLVPEERILHAARAVQAARSRPRPVSLPNILEASQRIVLGIPELDPYQGFRKETLVVPPPSPTGPLEWFSERRLYVEIGSELANLGTVVEALVALAVPVEVSFLCTAGPHADFLRGRGITVHERPPPLDAMLRAASHVLTTADLFATASAFCAGRAQILITHDEESRQIARQLFRCNVSAKLDQVEPESMVDQLQQVLTNSTLAENASDWAHRISNRQGPDGKAALLQALEASLWPQNAPPQASSALRVAPSL